MTILNQPSMNYLVVILHGYTCKVGSYNLIRKRVEQAYPGAKIIVPSLGIQVFSNKNPNYIVKNIVERIDKEWETGLFEHIILIGHSCGALLARKAYVYACGENEDAPFELPGFKKPRPWAPKIERIILMAGMNRGWSVNPHLSFFIALAWEFGILIGTMLSVIN